MKLKGVLVLFMAGFVAFYSYRRSHDLPAEHEGRAWLAAFNEGDRASLAAFLADRYPSRAQGPDVERLVGLRQQTGGFDLRKVEESATEHFSALVQERGSDQLGRLTVRVDPASPHVITDLSVRAIPRPPELPIARLSDRHLAAALGAMLDREAAADRFAGAVMVVHHGRTVFRGAYGLADRDAQLPATPETRFRIGSMNKMFTATAILQLAQAHKVALDAPLGAYVPDYPNRELAAKATIHDLLTHTAGTGDIFGPAFDAHRLELRTLQDYVRLYGERGPDFEPGSRWDYSNYGMVLLGVVIERVTGQSYYDYVRDHVFVPAGMTGSGSEPEDTEVPERCVGYTRDGVGPWQPSVGMLPYRGTPAGGGYSTVDDLARFAAALTSDVLLDARTTDLMTTGKVDGVMDGKYAYGFGERFDAVGRSFGHGGGAPGMNGDLRVYPGSGYVVAVLSNLDPPAAERVSAFITSRLAVK